jgi:apolipoprotein N-acyltransferase
MFASRTLFEHAARGVFGFGAIWLAISLGRSAGTVATAASMALGLAALVALRGCPICWTTGLVEMVWSRARGAVR